MLNPLGGGFDQQKGVPAHSHCCSSRRFELERLNARPQASSNVFLAREHFCSELKYLWTQRRECCRGRPAVPGTLNCWILLHRPESKTTCFLRAKLAAQTIFRNPPPTCTNSDRTRQGAAVPSPPWTAKLTLVRLQPCREMEFTLPWMCTATFSHL